MPDHASFATQGSASSSIETVKGWLRAALDDFKRNLPLSLTYGFALFALGWLTIGLFFWWGLGWMLLPALAGGLLVGPVATVGLYQVSRGEDNRAVASPGQLALAGAILMVFAMAWLRAATLIFAIFFGLRPFAGFVETMTTMFSTPQGMATILVGTVFGGLFAALGFAVSVFSIPMLVDREIDCFTAMGRSFSATTHNFSLMVTWAAVVTGLVLFGIATGLIGLIFIFPLLGYATWHAYADVFDGEFDATDPA